MFNLFNRNQTIPGMPVEDQIKLLQAKDLMRQKAFMQAGPQMKTGAGVVGLLLAKLLNRGSGDQLKKLYAQKAEQDKSQQTLLAEALKTNDYSKLIAGTTDPKLKRSLIMQRLKAGGSAGLTSGIGKIINDRNKLLKRKAELQKAGKDTSQVDYNLKLLEQRLTNKAASKGGVNVSVNTGIPKTTTQNIDTGKSMPVGKSTKSKMLFQMTEEGKTLGDLSAVMAIYKPEFLTAQRRGKEAVNRATRFLQMGQYFGTAKGSLQFEDFKSRAAKFFINNMKTQSGVAVSAQEFQRNEAVFPTPKDEPLQFVAKVHAVQTLMELAALRKMLILRGGVSKETAMSIRIEDMEKFALASKDEKVKQIYRDVLGHIGRKRIGNPQSAYDQMLKKARIGPKGKIVPETKNLPTLKAWDKAELEKKVNIGEQYIGPDGKTYTRSK